MSRLWYRTIRTCCIGLVFTLICLPGISKIMMAPYLQAVTTDSVYVLVECNSEKPVTVEYGLKVTYGKKAVTESIEKTDAAPPTFVHNIKLTGLKANRIYHYRARQDGNDASEDRSFVTAFKGGKYRFAYLADTRTNTDIHAKIAALVHDAAPRFSIYGGDLCGNGSYEMFKNEFFLPNELALISRVPFFNATGNHESWSTNTRAYTQAPASASGTQEYYSFDYGSVHFLALNTEIPCTPDSPQYKFAAADLAATKQPWKIVFMHMHPYGAGGHGDDANLQVVAKNLFVPNKVNAVFNGHSHFYQHNLVDGIHYLIVGSAGAPLHDPGTAPYVVKSVKDHNYAIIDVTPAALHIVVSNADGKQLDVVDIPKTKITRK